MKFNFCIVIYLAVQVSDIQNYLLYRFFKEGRKWRKFAKFAEKPLKYKKNAIKNIARLNVIKKHKK